MTEIVKTEEYEMENPIKVSIVCNTYNHEKYIRDALEGFVNQETDFAYEVLIHDDASTDQTPEIIKEYEKRFSELIKPIYETENQYHKHDGTISRLQNARAKGKYIATCEGDDYWTDPHKLQKQYDFMEKHPEYSMCGCSSQWMNVLTGKIQKRGTSATDRDISLEEFLFPKHGRPFLYASYFCRSDVWKSKPNWGFPVGDLPATYYAAIKGKVHMLADNMCVYRWFSEGSWTVRMYGDKERTIYYEKMITALEKMNQETNYEYDTLIQRKIREQRYDLAVVSHDYKAFTSEENRKIYKKRKLVFRMKDFLHCRFPNAFMAIMKIISNTR